MRYLIFTLSLLLMVGAVSAQNGPRIHQHKHYDTTIVEDYQKIKRRRLTTDVDSTGFAMYAWGDECFFKVQLREPGSVMNHYETGMLNGYPYVLYGGNNFWFKMYMTEYGAFEFDASLRKKPPNGRYSLTFPIQAKGLTFHYQDTLMDVDKWDSFRPDSIVGSYYVMHSTKTNNAIYLDPLSGEPNGWENHYQTGWAFSIFRPRAWDDGDDTTWGFVDIVWDSINADSIMFGNMELGVDSVWLASKKFPKDYPVTIDPTFGETAVTGSASGNSADQTWWNGLNAFSEAGDSPTGISMSIWSIDASGEAFVMGIYNNDGNSTIDARQSTLIEETISGNAGSDGWQTQNFTSSVALTDATSYWFAGEWDLASGHIWNNTAGTTPRWYHNVTYDGAMSDPCPASGPNNAGSTDRHYSWYVTYTVGGGPEPGGWQGGVIPVSIKR